MKKYVLAGCSGRALGMFAKPLEERFSKHARLAGIFDPNCSGWNIITGK